MTSKELQTALRTGGVFFAGDQAFLSLGDTNAPKGKYHRVQGGHVWLANLDTATSSSKHLLRTDPACYFLSPRRGNQRYGILRRTDTGEYLFETELTRQVFGMEREALEQLLTAYVKALRINFADFGHHDYVDPIERISCSTRPNRCDLSGILIPAEFPYLSLTLHRYWSNHTSLSAFYDHINLVTMNGDKRCASTRLMTAHGVTEETWSLLSHRRIYEARTLAFFDNER